MTNVIVKSQKIDRTRGTGDSNNILKRNKSSLQKERTLEEIFRTSFLIPKELYTVMPQKTIPVIIRRQHPTSIKISDLLKDSLKVLLDKHPLEIILAYRS